MLKTHFNLKKLFELKNNLFQLKKTITSIKKKNYLLIITIIVNNVIVIISYITLPRSLPIKKISRKIFLKSTNFKRQLS